MSHDDYPWARPVRRRSVPTSLLWPVLTLAAVAVVVGGLFLYRAAFRTDGPHHDPDAEAPPVAPRGSLTEIEKTNIRIYEENSPSVVHITTLTRQTNLLSVREVPEGTGSGFLWDDKGYVVTNFHVIRNADAARVTLADKTTYKAWYIGGAPEKDLAVLYIRAVREKLRPLKHGTSADLKVGQLTYAIGNPFGLDQTLTTGIISALGREIESLVPGRRIRDVIQTDASINPGNSGGPLLDSSGRLIGVNTAIYSPSGSSAGIGFAIPVDEVRRVVPALIRGGKVPPDTTRPGLGVLVGSEELRQDLKVPQGVVVTRVLPGSAAERAGIRPWRLAPRGEVVRGDVIVAVDGRAVIDFDQLTAALKGKRAGEAVVVEVLREGRREKVEVTLGTVE